MSQGRNHLVSQLGDRADGRPAPPPPPCARAPLACGGLRRMRSACAVRGMRVASPRTPGPRCAVRVATIADWGRGPGRCGVEDIGTVGSVF